jgi:hypothetical protein
MGEEGGGLGSLFGKAKKWLSDQGITDEDLAKAKEDMTKAKADQERWEAEAAAEKDADARADREARAGTSHVTLRGAVTGSVGQGMAVQTDQEDEALFVTVECVDPVPLDGGSFAGLNFGIPQYKGPGTYDLSTMDVTGLTYELLLDGVDEGFFWAPEYGQGVVTVSTGGSTAEVRFAFQDPGSRRIELEGTIGLS